MKKVLRRINPIQLGKILAIIYGLISLIIVPFILIGAVRSPQGKGPGILFAIFIPFLYIIGGFLGGIIGAFIYNLCAGWVGGIEIEVDDA